MMQKRKEPVGDPQVKQPTPKKICLGGPWHPLFKPESSRIILLSNDGIKLSVEKDLLSSYR
jgi:hypothetical protein